MYNVKHFVSFASVTFFFLLLTKLYNSIYYASKDPRNHTSMTKTRHKDFLRSHSNHQLLGKSTTTSS